jgi:hypothetical protein
LLLLRLRRVPFGGVRSDCLAIMIRGRSGGGSRGGSGGVFAISWSRYTINITGYSTSWPKGALQSTAGATAAWKLLVALGFGFGTVGASDWSSTRALGYHWIRRQSFLVILVPAMDGVMSLEQVAEKEESVAGIEERVRKINVLTGEQRTYGR